MKLDEYSRSLFKTDENFGIRAKFSIKLAEIFRADFVSVGYEDENSSGWDWSDYMEEEFGCSIWEQDTYGGGWIEVDHPYFTDSSIWVPYEFAMKVLVLGGLP